MKKIEIKNKSMIRGRKENKVSALEGFQIVIQFPLPSLNSDVMCYYLCITKFYILNSSILNIFYVICMFMWDMDVEQ